MHLGILGLLLWYLPAQVSDDAQEYQRCEAKCNHRLVECYYEKPKNDPGTKCDDQWYACMASCGPKK